MVWGIIAAWLICLASLSLPWPGIVLVVLVCCVAFFELASPGGGDGAKAGVLCDAVRRSPSAAMANAFHSMAERLGGGRRSAGKMEELATAVEKDAVVQHNKRTPSSAAAAAQQTGATFLKGSVGSFSRGGLMVTREGRVIYKVNQDRGLISHPSLNRARHTVFGVFDGHGENGEHVAALTMREVPRRLELHPDALRDPASALEDVFLDINSSLPASGINAVFGGCTAVVALVRGPRVWVANAGDSRALVAGRGADGAVVARGLTRDQNPDSPGERERIEAMGGFVSDPEEAGASARVWLDKTRTLVGLAMARSIGDLAVKRVGVIALPEVTDYVLTAEDEFLVLASDGVWEFIDNQEAAEVVQSFFDKGEDAAGACKGLMELANRRWSDMVGDYRDDITATVVRLPFLPPAAAAAAAAAAEDAAGDAATESSAIDVSSPSAKAKGTATAATTATQVAIGAAKTGGSGDGGGANAVGASSSASTERAAAGETPSSAASGKATLTARALYAATQPQPDGSPLRPRARSSPAGSLTGSSGGGGGVNVGGGAGGNGAGGGANGAGGGDGHGKSRPGSATMVDGSTASLVPTRSGDVLREEDNEEVDDDAVAALVTAKEEGEGRELASTPVITPEGVGEEEEEEEGEGKEEEEGEDTVKLLSTISKALVGKRVSRSATAAGTATATSASPAPEPLAPLKAACLPAETDDAEDQGEELLPEEGETEVEEEGAAAADAEDWEWNFGARENREPSREMREASKEFSSGSLDALVTGIDSRET